MMGGDEKDNTPVHKVNISEPFYMGIYEVSRAEYSRVMETEPPETHEADLPAGVTWNEAMMVSEL